MNIQKNINLKSYNTFQFDCIADYFVEIKNIDDLHELINTKVYKESPRLILGGGSNILLTKQRFSGLVIKNNILGKEIQQKHDTYTSICVGAGEHRNSFVKRSIEQGYIGLENLISIPGNVGAAPIQNIGAYGVEVGSSIKSVRYVDLGTGKVYQISGEDCHFGYRDSVFKHTLKHTSMITHVTFRLETYIPTTYIPLIEYGAIKEKLASPLFVQEEKKIGEISPKLIARAIAEIRASKLPDWTLLGTAGSFFKNPVISKENWEKVHEKFPELSGFETQEGIKLSAGQLIDLAGCKGISLDHVGTYKKHALVLVHYGGGTGQEIVSLAEHIQKQVQYAFGVHIEPEVNYIM